jgi:hypothetical protein
MVWGTAAPAFGIEWAYWLDKTLPNSRGVRRRARSILFFAQRPRRIDRELLTRGEYTRRESNAADHANNSHHDERIAGAHFEEQTRDHATDRQRAGDARDEANDHGVVA